MASNLRTSCEQTDNAFKKRVDEVQLHFDIHCDNKMMDVVLKIPFFARRCVKQNRSLKNKRQRQLSNYKRFFIFIIVSHHYHTIIIILVINKTSCKKLLCVIIVFRISYYTNDKPHQNCIYLCINTNGLFVPSKCVLKNSTILTTVAGRGNNQISGAGGHGQAGAAGNLPGEPRVNIKT